MRYLLLLDYDGTLTPIRKRPELALLSQQRRKTLRQLSHQPEIKMAIISGRKLSDIKSIVNLPGLIYVGNHGLEIEAKGTLKTHLAAKRFIPLLKRIKAVLINKVKIKGVWIEDKGLTLSFHFRQVSQNRRKRLYKLFYETIDPWQKKIRITKGKKVFEIRPPIDWDKGKAIEWLINRLKLKKYLPVYIGDDRTDEDAFRALKGKGISLKVGMGGKTAADKRLRNTAGVYRFLSRLGQKQNTPLTYQAHVLN